MANDRFNWPAPPGFRGFDEQRPVRIYQRNLPHWRQEDATYFVTFRLADSIPQPQLQALRRWREIWEKEHPEPRSEEEWQALAREIFSRTERCLDNGFGACELGIPQIADIMQQSLLKFQDDRYLVSCYVVMPNHVHAVMKPLGTYELEIILKDMKGYVSHRTNETLNRSGTLWQQESYDRIIRDEEHLYRVVGYIGSNPGKAGLPRTAWYRWVDPRWERAGWGFVT